MITIISYFIKFIKHKPFNEIQIFGLFLKLFINLNLKLIFDILFYKCLNIIYNLILITRKSFIKLLIYFLF